MLRLIVFLPLVFAVCSGLRWGGGELAALVEGRVMARAGAVAQALEADWPVLDADGLGLRVGGEAPEGEARLLLSALARALPRSVVTDETARPEAPAQRRGAMRVDLFRGPGGVTLTGRLPDAVMRAALLAALDRALPGEPVHDLTGLGAGDSGMADAEIAVAAAALGALTQPAIRIEPGRVAVSAGVPSAGARAEAEGLLRGVAGPGIVLDLTLRVPRGLIAPFRLVLAKTGSDRWRLEACAVRDRVEAETLAAALALVGLRGERARCEIGLGGPELDWAAASVAGVMALRELPRGRFELTDAQAVLSASGGTEGFEGALQTLAGAMPAGFALEGAVADGAAAAAEGARLWLRIERDGEAMRLAGRVPGLGAREALLDVATARRGQDRVDHARLEAAAGQGEEDNPARFQKAAVAAIEVMADEAIGGHVTVTAAGVVADLVSGTGAAGAAALRRLGAGLPAAHRLESRLKVDVPGAVARLPMSEARCVAALNEAVVRAPITFDPGSVRLDTASEQRVDALARLLARCRGARVEVGGHTDNQGRASMNEQLSRARAEAVVAALEARGVGPRVAILTAKGYGETAPVASNGTPSGRARNRRIAFRIPEETDQVELR